MSEAPFSWAAAAVTPHITPSSSPWGLDPDADRVFAAAFAPERTIVREVPTPFQFEMPPTPPRADLKGSTMRGVRVIVASQVVPVKAKTPKSAWTSARNAGLILFGVITLLGILACVLSATIQRI